MNIAAGLDTTFYRVDNGIIHWYDLDLPAVIDIRRRLLSEPDRTTYVAKSLFDPSWCKDIKYAEGGVFMVAGGVLPFFEASEVKQFFLMLADNFPGGEIIFDAPSKMNDDFRAWGAQFPPEQRYAMRAAWMEALKDWWAKAPQDQKDKLINMIAALKTWTKPKGKELADLEEWWNQLNAKEIGEIWRDFRASSNRYFGRWTLEDAYEITKWDSRITIMDQSPLFKDIPRNPSLSTEIRQFMDYSYKSGRLTIFQLRV